MDRSDLPDSISTPRTIVRRAVAGDMGEIMRWPRYEGFYEALNMTNEAARAADGRFWWERIDAPDRCHYSVVLRTTGELIGVLVFCKIDWEGNAVGNMGIRIRADLCGSGLGTESLSALLDAARRSGVEKIRLDVAATNARAIACYKKCGMDVVDEWWRDGKGPADPDAPQWQPQLQHFRKTPDGWSVRFYWMEIAR